MYLIDVNFNGAQWVVERKFNDFCTLYDQLVN